MIEIEWESVAVIEAVTASVPDECENASVSACVSVIACVLVIEAVCSVPDEWACVSGIACQHGQWVWLTGQRVAVEAVREAWTLRGVR